MKHETQRDIHVWQKATFPERSVDSVLAHLDEEIAELKDALKLKPRGQRIAAVAEEIADCMILLSCLASDQGVTVAGAIDAKMEANRKRRWRRDDRGGYWRHVEGEQEA